MASVRVNESYRTEFERRLSVVGESLSVLRQLIETGYNDEETDGWDRSILSTVFITGDCAAWLAGRFDDFNDTIDLLFVNGSIVPFHSFTEVFKTPDDGPYKNIHVSDDEHLVVLTLDEKHADSIMHDTRLCYVRKNKLSVFSKIDAVSSICDFRSGTVWNLFDSDTVSTFINLFDTNVIYTTDYDTMYDRRCLVTNNGCVKHGMIVYPALSKKRYSDYRQELREREDLMRVRFNYDQDCRTFYGKAMKSNDRKQRNIKRLHNYYRLARSRHCINDSFDRPLSFLRMDNCLIRRREALIRKVFRQWQHRTLMPPSGYGYKKCLNRFTNRDAVTKDEDDLCTC